jgi:hypothetical protein
MVWGNNEGMCKHNIFRVAKSMLPRKVAASPNKIDMVVKLCPASKYNKTSGFFNPCFKCPCKPIANKNPACSGVDMPVPFISVYSSVCIHPCVFISVYSSVCIHPCVFISVYSSVCIHPCVFIRVYSSVCIHPCVFIRVYSSVCIHQSGSRTAKQHGELLVYELI